MSISSAPQIEQNPKFLPMDKPSKIFGRSIYTFLQNYQHFTSIAAILAFPFSNSVLLSQVFLPSYSPLLFPTIYHRLSTLFQVAGFPPSKLSTFLSFKLSQTISQSIFTLPFTLTFFLLAKAYVIASLNQQKPTNSPPPSSSLVSIFSHLLHTYICNFILIISANATSFFLLFFYFNILEGLGFSSPTFFLFFSAFAAILYSIILAYTFIICNLALVLSGIEKFGGYLSIPKASVMIRGRVSTALSLVLPVNLALIGLEALFQFRIVRVYNAGETRGFSLMALEGMLIAYLYTIVIVLDTIVSCNFYRSCRTSFMGLLEGELVYRIEIAEQDDGGDVSLKVSKELP